MTDMFAGVRFARPDEEDAVYALLLGLHEENGLFPLDETRARTGIRAATAQQGGIVGVIEDGNGIEGTVGIFMEQLWYSADWWLVERWNFVRKDCRRSTHAKRLIEFSEWCADNVGLDLLMAIVSNEQTEAKVRLYRRKIPYVGGFFLYRSKTKATAPAHHDVAATA